MRDKIMTQGSDLDRFDLNRPADDDEAEVLRDFPLRQRELLLEASRMLAELREIKASKAWRLVKSIWGHPIYRFARRLAIGLTRRRSRLPQPASGDGEVVIEALGVGNPSARGSEVWVLEAIDRQGATIPWEQFRLEGGFITRFDPNAPLREVLYTAHTGRAVFPGGDEIWRLRLLTHPWSGLARLLTSRGEARLDLYREQAGDVYFDLQSGFDDRRGEAAAGRTTDFVGWEREWVEAAAARRPVAVAVLHPEWRGIRSATGQHFDTSLFVGDGIDVDEAMRLARMIVATGCTKVVFSGFALSHRHIVLTLRKIAPRLKLFVLWHGSFLQTREDYNWRAYQAVLDLARAGRIDKVGFVKTGMAEAHARLLGIRTGFVLNYLSTIPPAASAPLAGGPHIGLWSLWSDNWRKPPYAMLVAASQIPGAVIHGSHASRRLQEFISLLGVKVAFSGEAVPQEQMPEHLARMHLNMYVTLSECAPMVPLESLAAGSPCLTGPTSHLFEDHAYLHSRLVVPYPDRWEVIRDSALRCLEEREAIVAAYRDYAPEYNRRARSSYYEFLEEPDGGA